MWPHAWRILSYNSPKLVAPIEAIFPLIVATLKRESFKMRPAIWEVCIPKNKCNCFTIMFGVLSHLTHTSWGLNRFMKLGFWCLLVNIQTLLKTPQKLFCHEYFCILIWTKRAIWKCQEYCNKSLDFIAITMLSISICRQERNIFFFKQKLQISCCKSTVPQSLRLRRISCIL